MMNSNETEIIVSMDSHDFAIRIIPGNELNIAYLFCFLRWRLEKSNVKSLRINFIKSLRLPMVAYDTQMSEALEFNGYQETLSNFRKIKERIVKKPLAFSKGEEYKPLDDKVKSISVRGSDAIQRLLNAKWGNY